MKTRLSKGEVQHLVTQSVKTFEESIMGGYSESCTTMIFEDSVLVRFRGDMQYHGENKDKTLKSELLHSYISQKRQELLDSARPLIVTLIERIVDCSVITVHSDVCSITDDRVYVFTLSQILDF